MLAGSLLTAALLGSLAQALPQPEAPVITDPVGIPSTPCTTGVSSTMSVVTGDSVPSPNRNINLKPCPNPKVDKHVLDNLKCSREASMHFTPDQEDIGDAYAYVNITGSTNPLVSIDDSDRVKVSCTDTKASLKFEDKEAYDLASEDWQGDTNVVFITYNSECGDGPGRNARDYMLAKEFTMLDESMTIEADIQFVDMRAAFGDNATVSADWGGVRVEDSADERDTVPTPMPRATSPPSVRSLQKRIDFFDDIQDGFEDHVIDPVKSEVIDPVKSVGEEVVSKGEDVVSQVVSKGEEVVSKGEEAVSKVKDIFKGGEATQTINWDAEVTETAVDAMWGTGFNIFPNLLDKATPDFSKLTNKAGDSRIDCTDCNTNGTVTLAGRWKWKLGDFTDPFDVIEEAVVEIQGDIGATLEFGLQGSSGKSISLVDRALLIAGIPGLTWGGIGGIGPQIGVDISAGIDILSDGEMQLGASVRWPKMKVTIDAKKQEAKAEGFDKPDWQPRMEVDGVVGVEGHISLPIFLGIGINIDPLKFEKMLQVVNEAGIRFGAESVSAKPAPEGEEEVEEDPNMCKGTSLYIDGFNDLGVDIFEMKSVSITSVSTNIYKTCVSTKVSSSTFPTLSPTGNEGIGGPGATGSGTGTAGGTAAGTGAFPEETGAADEEFAEKRWIDSFV